MIKKMV